jgi:RNA recognition motif-containing protein
VGSLSALGFSTPGPEYHGADALLGSGSAPAWNVPLSTAPPADDSAMSWEHFAALGRGDGDHFGIMQSSSPFAPALGMAFEPAPSGGTTAAPLELTPGNRQSPDDTVGEDDGFQESDGSGYDGSANVSFRALSADPLSSGRGLLHRVSDSERSPARGTPTSTVSYSAPPSPGGPHRGGAPFAFPQQPRGPAHQPASHRPEEGDRAPPPSDHTELSRSPPPVMETAAHSSGDDSWSGDAPALDARTHNPCKLFVGGIGADTTDSELASHFSQFGKVISAVAMRNKMTSAPRGFGFVVFDGLHPANLALSATHVIRGRPIDVRPAVPKDQDSAAASERRPSPPLHASGLPPLGSAWGHPWHGGHRPEEGHHFPDTTMVPPPEVSGWAGVPPAWVPPMSSGPLVDERVRQQQVMSEELHYSRHPHLPRPVPPPHMPLPTGEMHHPFMVHPVMVPRSLPPPHPSHPSGGGGRGGMSLASAALRRVFVGGLPQDVDESGLLGYFAKFGDIMDCEVMRDRGNGRSRGFGFVTFASPESANAAATFGDHIFRGRRVDVKFAHPREAGRTRLEMMSLEEAEVAAAAAAAAGQPHALASVTASRGRPSPYPPRPVPLPQYNHRPPLQPYPSSYPWQHPVL